jgi:hypothetical protein
MAQTSLRTVSTFTSQTHEHGIFPHLAFVF